MKLEIIRFFKRILVLLKVADWQSLSLESKGRYFMNSSNMFLLSLKTIRGMRLLTYSLFHFVCYQDCLQGSPF